MNTRAAAAFFALMLAVLFPLHLSAHPYASGVTNQSGVVSWVLNEAATDVQILFDNGTLTNDLGTAPVVGTNTFNLSTHTNFSIVVYKIGSNSLTQISTDSIINNNFSAPHGVVVNRNAKTGNFGRVYIANSSSGTASNGRATTRGIYALDAASGDALGLGNTAAVAGMTFGTSTTYSPYKLNLGVDDALYVGDCGTVNIGGIWRVDANLSTSANLFGLANPSTNTFSKGTNFGRMNSKPIVTGTLAASNLVVKVVSWDLNLSDSSGDFAPSTNDYQNIYEYDIGAGPLPWKSFPKVMANPIGIGPFNTVGIDMDVAPDGKIFLTAYRVRASDGYTNVCVLDTNGAVLWDSRTQSAAYFGDTTNDHLSASDFSISVSPDDKYVLVQNAANDNFMLMSLTNGVPDISTLTTNTTVGATGGSTAYASTWDAADNIYVTSSGSQTLRVFSLGLTTTCVTSNTASGTNGSFQMTAISAAGAAILTQPASQTVQCSSNAAFSVVASGTSLNYQWYLGNAVISGATNAMLNLGIVTIAQSGAQYKVVVTNSLNSVTSSVATLTVVDTIPPVVTMNGTTPVYISQGGTFTDPGATAWDGCAGAIAVVTNGAVNRNVAGTYPLAYVATDPSGNSATNTRTVYVLATNGPVSLQSQPASQAVQCFSPVTFSVIASGGAPIVYQWYNGANALMDGSGVSGSATASLTISSAVFAQAGSYRVVVSNALNTVTSSVATLTLTDTTAPAITLFGGSVTGTTQGAVFADPGAIATDSCGATLPVVTNNTVNVNSPGTYLITYSATNMSGVSASAQRTVMVSATNSTAAATPNLIPLPVTLQTRPGTFTLCPPQRPLPSPATAALDILVDASSPATGQYLAAALFKSTGYQFQVITSAETNAVRNAILITTSNALSTLNTEGYELTVAPDSVVIRAPAQSGAFYGVQSLLQLLPPQIYSPRIVTGISWVAPCVYIQDQPSYSWRGVMLDVARHFYDKEEVKQLLDAMAMHKLNTFHWHLVDDQGWRLEITNYPNLTVAAGFRTGIDYGLPPRSSMATNAAGKYGGFYTQAQAREIVAYAAARHITVVPEIEMPCHSTPGLVAYPQYGCGNAASSYSMDYPSINYGVDLYSLGTAGTMTFLKGVLTEVMQIFPGKYIHCGGDEVISSGDTQWNSYNADVTNMQAIGITPNNGSTSIIQYQRWFSTNISAFLQANGRVMMGWTEFENGGVIPNAALMDWQAGTSSQATNVAKAGLPVVMSPDTYCYINYVEGTSNSLPIEPPFIVGGVPQYLALSKIYSFNPMPTGLAAAYTNNILGAQCNAWGEYIPSFRNAMFKIFPRETALAEITWTPLAQQGFASFTNRLAVQKQRFAQMGVNYDHESVPAIGTWGPTVSTSATTMNFDITTNVTAAGEIDVNFWYTSGANALAISSVALLQNGVQVDIDVHAGSTGASQVYPLYVLHLPETKPGATYTIRAVVSATGGTASSGTIYLPNWN